MMIQKKTLGVTLASAAAALLVAGATISAPVAASAAGVKCSGINSCKGTGACKTATNECKGMNSCKGHGWVPAGNASGCTMKGGKVVE